MRTKNNHTHIIPDFNIQRYLPIKKLHKCKLSHFPRHINSLSIVCFNKEVIRIKSQLNKSIKLLDFKYLKLFHFQGLADFSIFKV
jgi:hypothetical protein